jgi:hypothetical protein
MNALETAMHSKLLIALMSLSLCEVSVAQVPHTFSAGTPAKASEVNDNFTALSSQISNDQNVFRPMSR